MRGDTLESIGLNFQWSGWPNTGRTVLKSIPILIFAVIAFVIGTIIMANIVSISEGSDLSKYNYLQGNLPVLLISLAGVFLVSSFGEEIVYRGFLMTRIGELFEGKTRTALFSIILVSSIVFGFAHFEWGATGIIQTGFMGAALSISFIWVGRTLWPLILAHCYMDTLLLVPLYFANGAGS